VTGDRGSLSAFLAVVAFSLLVLVGLVVDGGRTLAGREAAWDTAQEAARVGADQISVQELRSGQVAVDPHAAQEAAQAFVSDRGYQGSVTVSGDVVTVDVNGSEPTAILGLIGIHQISITASASAVDVHGVTRED